MQRALPSLRAAGRAEPLHEFQRLDARLQHRLVARGAGILQQNHGEIAAVAAGRVLEMAAAVFAFVTKRAVGALHPNDTADLGSFHFQPFLARPLTK